MNAFENKIARACYQDLQGLNNIVLCIGIEAGSAACHNNTFGNNCYNSTFGDNCTDNTFGNGCSNNTFGNNCSNNAFGNNCCANTFGNACHNNTFGDNCTGNTFGNACYDNTFGKGCTDNTFGDNCCVNALEYDCSYLKGTYDGTNGVVTKSCHVLSGTHGSSSNLCELPTKLNTNRSVTYVGMNSDGDIIMWVPADEHGRA